MITLLVVGERADSSSATGARRCKAALKDGIRCEGNLTAECGLGGGEEKAGTENS